MTMWTVCMRRWQALLSTITSLLPLHTRELMVKGPSPSSSKLSARLISMVQTVPHIASILTAVVVIILATVMVPKAVLLGGAIRLPTASHVSFLLSIMCTRESESELMHNHMLCCFGDFVSHLLKQKSRI